MSSLFPEDLYRTEALAAFREKTPGVPVKALPVSWIAFSVLILLAIAAFLVVAATNSYSRRELGRGWLQYTGGEIIVRFPIDGRVQAIFVENETVVSNGQPLFLVSSSRTMSEGVQYSQHFDQLISQELETVSALENNSRTSFEMELMETRARIGSINDQISAIDRQIAVAMDRGTLLETRFSEAIDFEARGLISRRALEERHIQSLEPAELVAALAVRRADLLGQLEALRTRALQIPVNANESQLTLRQNRLQLERLLLEARSQEGLLVEAPESGQVSASQLAVGNSARTGERALSIVAADTELQAEIYLPSRAMARIREGQTVRINYDAFPNRRYGSARGTVDHISTTIIRPEEIPSALNAEEAGYRVVVALDHQEIVAFDRAHQLRSGLTLSAEFVLEEQTLLQWLLEPLFGRGH